jgi:Coenzyme PQQ synthesis protein D (PqqD)
MSNMTSATKPTRRAGVLAQQVKPGDPTVVLLNPKSGEYYTLEAVGSRVWQLCDGKSTIAEMAATLSQEFDAPSDVIEGDIVDLVKDLLNEGLVEGDR